jgi:alginate O-acetyltransferase complex protein AlgI
VLFSSSIFLVYFLPVVLLLYFVLPHKAKNIFLLLASIAFYSWGAPLFIFVILFTTTLDYFLVQLMWQSRAQKRKKLLLILSVTLNVGLLFYFKYCNFFIENINHLLSKFDANEIHWVNVILPIGISFYTFESLTYVIDVYRNEHKPLNNFFQYQLYILLFPKLIAGPIIRFSEIADQMTGRFATYNVDMILNGFCRFAIGLGKKVLIANALAKFANFYFYLSPESLTTIDCWMGALGYTFQIYFDFSGYSDMAIGLGKMFGFNFPENFNNPYTSKSITEFWRRWHMTLGSWMKNYLYIPLGGNKVKSQLRLYFNLWLVFILSGFWHGAEWTFIIWGLYHGFWLVLERMFLLKFLEKGKIFSVVFTFIVVTIGWVFFRHETFDKALRYVIHMFDFSNFSFDFSTDTRNVYAFGASIFFSVFILLPFGKKIQDYVFFNDNKSNVPQLAFVVVSLLIFVVSLASITATDFNPFIYFRF